MTKLLYKTKLIKKFGLEQFPERPQPQNLQVEQKLPEVKQNQEAVKTDLKENINAKVEEKCKSLLEIVNNFLKQDVEGKSDLDAIQHDLKNIMDAIGKCKEGSAYKGFRGMNHELAGIKDIIEKIKVDIKGINEKDLKDLINHFKALKAHTHHFGNYAVERNPDQKINIEIIEGELEEIKVTDWKVAYLDSFINKLNNRIHRISEALNIPPEPIVEQKLPEKPRQKEEIVAKPNLTKNEEVKVNLDKDKNEIPNIIKKELKVQFDLRENQNEILKDVKKEPKAIAEILAGFLKEDVNGKSDIDDIQHDLTEIMANIHKCKEGSAYKGFGGMNAALAGLKNVIDKFKINKNDITEKDLTDLVNHFNTLTINVIHFGNYAVERNIDKKINVDFAGVVTPMGLQEWKEAFLDTFVHKLNNRIKRIAEQLQ